MITDTGKKIIATLVDDPNLTDTDLSNKKTADNIADIDILRPPVSDDDVADITRLSRDEQDALKLKIRQLDLRRILPLDKQGYGIVCPFCGNGSGHTGDGVNVNYDDSDGHFWYHCFKENDCEGDLLSIICKANNLQYSDFYKILAIGNKLLALAENSSVKPSAITKTRKTYSDDQIAYFKDLREKFQTTIDQLPLEDRRGLTLDTLQHFHCGYNTLTKRIIIPTGDFSSNAILINSERKFATDNGWTYDKCLNYGSKALFNPCAIVPNTPVIVVEGEIDAMSIWQVSGVNVCAIGGTDFKNFLSFVEDNVPADSRKDFQFIVLLDNDNAGRNIAPQLVDGLLKLGCPAFSDVVVNSSTKIDANDILIQNGDEALKACVDSAVSKFNEKLDEIRKSISNVDHLIESKPRVKNPTTKEIMPDCPVDLRIPAKFGFSHIGISYDGNLICNTPVVITKKLRDVETNEVFSEIAYYDRYSKKWLTSHFSDDVLLDKRNIGKLMKFGISFTQDDAKYLTKYFKDLPFEPHNLLTIPHHNLYKRIGWTDDSFSKYIHPEHLEDGDVLYDPTGTFKNKFTSKGDFKSWCKAIKKLFTNPKGSPAFKLIFGAACAAPLCRILGLRNPQFLLWCSSGKGKSAIAKIATSIYGNPEELKFTFNGTVNSICAIPAYFSDMFIWQDEYQSASSTVRDNKSSIVYSFADGKTRSRSNRDGTIIPITSFYAVKVITAEQPILTDNTDAGAYNRLLSISSDKLFPPEINIADVHRFFGNNYGHFGIQWINFIKSHIDEIKAQFAKNQAYFSDIARAFHWTNGWIDQFAAILTALQFAIPLIDQDEIKLSVDDIKNLFINNFEEIEREVPRESSFSNQQRAIHMLEDYVNSHPRFFKREVQFGSVHTMKQSTDGNSFELYGFQFLDGTFGFIPTALNKIIQNELGFSSANAILRGWQDEGLLQPANNKSAYARRKKVIENGNIRNMTLVCFNENVLNADVSVNIAEDHTDE